MAFGSFFKDRKVLVVGNTGFKGSWLSFWLHELGARVHGIGLEPDHEPPLFEILGLRERIAHTTLDIRDREALRLFLQSLKPDVVFHLAAKALVRASYEHPLETLDTNVTGTMNLLSAIADVGYSPQSPCSVVVVTSDKCYENRETQTEYREGDAMGGHDIYSASKGMVELLVSSWRRSFWLPEPPQVAAIRIATCRAGNVIGGGDRSTDRIVPDCVLALAGQNPISVRSPSSVRPWQHVLEPLSGYLHVASLLGRFEDKTPLLASAWNFGPGPDSEQTVGTLCDSIVQHWGSGRWDHIHESGAAHEACLLKLAIEKARDEISWSPTWSFDETIRHTIHWYREAQSCAHKGVTMRALTAQQISEFVAAARKGPSSWASDSTAFPTPITKPEIS